MKNVYMALTSFLWTFPVRLLAFCSKSKTLNSNLCRNYATIIKRELEVVPFCDVYVDLPYHIQVKPLNIHKYHNCDKLIIQIDERFEQFLEHDVDGNRVNIFSNLENNRVTVPNDIYCSIKAPIKANLYVNSERDITVGHFNGDKLHLQTSEGNIFIDKFQGDSVKLKTNKGDITLRELVQASNITAEILEHGSIISSRLQGLNLQFKTKKGNISVESSYSYESYFEIENGSFDLQNVHKSCKFVLKEGTINLVGFDGNLHTVIENGSADIQLVRITKDSEINILNGSLNLKIGDACQDYVQFKIQAKDCDIAENIKSAINKINKSVVLTPDINEDSTVLVNCLNGTVNVESASWQDMIKLKLKK